MKICELADISAGSAKAIELTDGGEIVLIRVSHEEIVAYHNRCPHTGASLNWLPDQFLDHTGEYIQCSNHAALFRIEDGVCIFGPCSGQSLVPVPLKIHAGQVFAVSRPPLSRQRK